MNTPELIQIQFTLECIGLDKDGLLVRIPGPDPDEIARVYVFYGADEYYVFFRHDLGPSIREQISKLSPENIFHDREAIKTILDAEAPCSTVGVYQTYLFPDRLDPDQFPDVVEQVKDNRSWYTIIRAGQVVSACGSVRENEQAGECYVFTEPVYRGRGYARQTTAAWAYQLQRLGKIAFYSHALDNPASQGVAKSLGLTPCFTLVNYD